MTAARKRFPGSVNWAVIAILLTIIGASPQPSDPSFTSKTVLLFAASIAALGAMIFNEPDSIVFGPEPHPKSDVDGPLPPGEEQALEDTIASMYSQARR